MDLGLAGKVVIVTGGASGIGKAAVETFAEEGAIPVFIDKDRKKGTELSKILQDNSKDHLFIYGDLTNDDFCEHAIDKTIRAYGGVDVLVNNAGKNDRQDIGKITPQKFRESLDRNLVHYFSMSNSAWPHLIKSKGNIIFTGSKVALVGEGETTAYAAAKGGVNGLTRELATKSNKGNLGIRVNCVIPAIVDTHLYREYLEEAYSSLEKGLKVFGKNIPLENRATTPQEIANEIVFLASPRASHTTGQIRFVDGGYVYTDRMSAEE